MKSSLIIVGAIAIASSAIIYSIVSSDNDNLVTNQIDKLITAQEKKLEDLQKEAEVLAPVGLSRSLYTASNLETGYIGINAETNIDNPHDNTFHIALDGEIESGRQAWLEYDLYGVEDYTSVSRAINDQVAIGGAFVKLSQDWSVQREKIDANLLHKGDNIIRFSIPGNSDFNYIVKNVRIRFDDGVDASRRIVLNQPMSKSYYNRYGYISGFVSGYGSEHAKIFANGKPVRSNQSVFEGIVDQIADHGSDWKAVITAVFEDGQTISDTAHFCNPATCDFTNEISTDLAFSEAKVNAQMPVHMSIPGFELNGEPGSVNNNVTLSVTGLRAQDMALPRLAMVNVTGGSDGYRCLPHGNNFAKEVEVRVKYDTARIPKGYGPKDIRTFYYSEDQGDWIMLPYDTFDLASSEIISHTTHFTDFINAILKTPESPQTQAFTPTSMKDMKFADPIAHINMMSPPQANNSGSANMSYPIQIPAGRQGMQPQLAISYNSEGGNGWLGVGWGMNIPSISVETRWGVPLYSTTQETEEYLVNGQQIVELDITTNDTNRLPLIHQSTYRNRSTANEVYYSYRVEGAFDRLIRHGNSPSTYWWEVIDKQGTHYYYGKYYSDPGINQSCILGDPTIGNVAQWMLCEMRDVYGNSVHYYYQKVTRQNGAGAGGQQVYLSNVKYTGYNSTPGKYSVDFEYDGGSRSDYSIAANYGFLTVTDKLLTNIHVKYDGAFIRSYHIKYKDGAYGKKLICSIADVTDAGKMGQVNELSCNDIDKLQTAGVKVHSFEYYEETGLDFGGDVTILSSWEIPEEVGGGLYTVPTQQGIGRSKSTTVSFGGSLCLGLGNPTLKNNSVGGNASLSLGSLKEKVTYLDINGDGLKDKLIRNGSQFDFYKGSLDPFNRLIFSGTSSSITTLPNLGTNWSLSNSLGCEFQAGLPNLSGSASLTWSEDKSITNKYFSDVNADGYIDYISEGDVYYNYPDNSTNIPQFTLESAAEQQTVGNDPCYSIYRDGSIDPAFGSTDAEMSYVRRDPVRMWIAPDMDEGGYVRINSMIQRVSNQSTPQQDIRYEIQHNGSSVHCGLISANDMTVHNETFCIFGVTEGDRIYFRILSDNQVGQDEVNWVTELNTLGCSAVNNYYDADEKPIHDFSYNDDAVIHDMQYFIAPLTGVINVSGTLNSIAQSDDLQFIIKHNQTLIHNTTFFNSVAIQNHTFSYTINVTEGDSIPIKIISNTNVNWTDINFDATIQYTSASNFQIIPGNPFNNIVYKPSVKMSIFPKRNKNSMPNVMQAGTYIVYPDLLYSGTGTYSGEIVLSAKTQRKLLDKETFQVLNGVIQGSPTLQFSISNTETVFFDYFTTDRDLSNDISNSRVHISQNGTVYFYAGYYSVYTEEMKLFGNLYRGWGQFSYYDQQPASNCSLIDQNALSLDFSNMCESYLESFPLSSISSDLSFSDVQAIFSTFGIPDPSTMPFVPMKANRELGQWEDFAKLAYTNADIIGTGGSLGQLYSITNDPDMFDPEDSPIPNFESPVPANNSSGYVRVVSKENYQITESFSYSLSGGSASLNTTVSNSDSKGYTDYTDMNGDRYPDIVGKDKIQYTTAYGGLSSVVLNNPQPQYINSGKANANGQSIGIGGFEFEGSSSKNESSSKDNTVTGSAGLGTTSSNSSLKTMYGDLNGDGLADRINKNSGTVAFNTGYGFTSYNPFSVSAISESYSTSSSFSTNFSVFNKYQDSWSGGLSGSVGDNYDNKSLMDVNNDGLADVCITNGTTISAYINTGNSFLPAQTICSSYSKQIRNSTSTAISGNIAATFGIPIWIFKITFSSYFSMSYSVSSDNYRLDDLNGDGYLDMVYVDEHKVKAKYGIAKKTNVLKKVTTPLESEYTIDYTLKYPGRSNPSAKWVMASLIVYDGFVGDGQDFSYYKYDYANPVYHRFEREFFGYETVTTLQYNNFGSGSVCYRKTEEKFHNNNFLFKGLKKYECTIDGSNTLLTSTTFTWDPKEIPTGNIVTNPPCFDDVYPAISQEDKFYYDDLSSNGINTMKTYLHGPFGNVKQYCNYGDVNYSEDDLRAEIFYIYNIPQHYLSMVRELQVYDYQSNLINQRGGAYNSYGRIHTISITDGNSTGNIDIQYDLYGNLEHIAYPENVNNERLGYSYEYDNVVHSFPVLVTDYWGNKSSASYDYRLGLPTKTWDIAGNPMSFSYYDDGKPKTVIGPKEIAANVLYTIKFEYWDEATSVSNSNLWAKTSHYDPLVSGNEFVTVNFADGLGRSIQSKKKATIDGNDRMVVSGRTDYDAYGRAYRTSLPTDQALGTELIFYNYTPTNFATTTFDVLDRPLVQTSFDNTTVSYSYGINADAFGKLCFETVVTDPKGIVTTKYTDARGLNTSVTAPLNTITKFVYDPMGTLISSYDPENNKTNYTYDLLGRLISRNHPDAGITSYTYDMAGNVLTTQTANLAGISQFIQYNYTDARLSSIVYPQNPEMSVYYVYGAPNTGNQSGRLIRQQDASGVQTFEYGNMGELVKNIHTFVVPEGNAYTYETDWVYDSWNRVKQITYPDGEVATYSYNNGGQLIALSGLKGSESFSYVQGIKYNLFGARTLIEYGNSTYAEYAYDPLNQRLTNLTSYESTGRILQSLNYSYDNASNIENITNNSDWVGTNQSLGGDYTYAYEYDDLYRLTVANGSFDSRNNNTLYNSLSMSYSDCGNILSKEVYAETEIGGNVQTINYANTYNYNDRPHTVTQAGCYKYEWDANGNLFHRGNSCSSDERLLCWDEENRLTTVYNSVEKISNLSSYIYNASGERTWKMTGDVYEMFVNGVGYVKAVDYDKTLYASPYLVVDDAEYTKHYYIEGERVCTKIGGHFMLAPTPPNGTPLDFISCNIDEFQRSLRDMVDRGIECTQFNPEYVNISPTLNVMHRKAILPETNLYFYHPDHIGSSSFITDATGYAVQHLQYLPFGETFVDQQNGYDSRYTFSAKEKDDETQYSYFGARYYDSDLSVWLSVDPMSDKYPNSSPYLYCENNPVVYVDPNGEFKTRFGAWRFRLIYGGEIIKAKYGDNAGQYYVMKEMGGSRNTNHGWLKSKSKNEDIAYKITLDEVGINTKISFGWGNGNGSSKRNLLERAFDYVWDALESVDNILNDRNRTPVHTSDPYPDKAPESLWFDPYFEGNTNPNVSDKNYDDKHKSSAKTPYANENEQDLLYVWRGVGSIKEKDGTTRYLTKYDTIKNDPNPPKNMGPNPDNVNIIVVP